MQGGIHLLSGLLLGRVWKNKPFRVSVLFGAIIPDIDLLFVGLAYLITGEEKLSWHRSGTHSLLFITLLFFLVLSLDFIPKIKEKYNYDFRAIAIGLAAGIILHVTLDMFYWGDVWILWPFSGTIGFPVMHWDTMTELNLKLLQATDFYTVTFFFYIPILILCYEKDLHKKVRLPFIIYAIVDFIIITVFIVLAFTTDWSYEVYVVNLYYIGTFLMLVSIFAPLIFHEAVYQFEIEKKALILVLSMFFFSQLLFAF